MSAPVPDGYRIRPATEADLPSLDAIRTSLASGPAGSTEPHEGAGTMLPLAVLDLCRAAGTLWSATDARGDPVGFLAASDLDGSLCVLDLHVMRGHRRRGLGSALLRVAIDHARWAFYPALSLITDRSLPWGGPFCARFGFVALRSDALSPGLGAKLAAEIARGHDPARRCAMAKRL